MFAYSPPTIDFRTEMQGADGLLSVIRPTAFVPVIICGAPRELQSFAAGSAQLRRPGAYILLREGDEAGDLPRCNIGEGEPVFARVVAKMESCAWQWVAVITCDAPQFTKCHAEHLEWRLTALAEGARRVVVERDRSPKRRQLPMRDEAALDDMVATVCKLIGGQGYPLLERGDGVSAGLGSHWQDRAPARPTGEPTGLFRQAVAVPESALKDPIPEADGHAAGADSFILRYRNLNGTAFEDAKGFHVMAGTEVSRAETQTLPDQTRRRRSELRETGILVAHPFDARKLVFARSHTFENGTCAAKLVAGSKQSWRTVWIERGDRARGGHLQP